MLPDLEWLIIQQRECEAGLLLLSWAWHGVDRYPTCFILLSLHALRLSLHAPTPLEQVLPKRGVQVALQAAGLDKDFKVADVGAWHTVVPLL